MTTVPPALAPTSVRASGLRRAAVAGAGVLACALPTVWTLGTVRELVTGAVSVRPS